MKKFFWIFAIFIIWRLFLFLPLFAGYQHIEYRKGFEYTILWGYTHTYKPVESYFLFPWANFDGVAYLSIAGKGYGTENIRFFPAYPILIHTVSQFFGTGDAFGGVQFFTAFFIANLSFLFSLFLLYTLVRLDYSDRTAFLTVITLLVFPVSFFFGSIYSESLFLLLSLLCFYFARRRQWLLASIFGILLTATRLIGICIVPALIYEFVVQEDAWKYIVNKNKKKLTEILVKILPLFIIPLGLISFMVFDYMQWKNPLQFLVAQGELANGRSAAAFVFFPQTMYRYIKILFTVSHLQFEFWISLLELCSFVFGSVLLYGAWKKRIRVSYIIFSFLCFLIPASSGTFTALPRYMVVLFPLFLALGLVKNKLILGLYIGISLILLFILTMFFSRGYYIA